MAFVFQKKYISIVENSFTINIIKQIKVGSCKQEIHYMDNFNLTEINAKANIEQFRLRRNSKVLVHDFFF